MYYIKAWEIILYRLHLTQQHTKIKNQEALSLLGSN